MSAPASGRFRVIVEDRTVYSGEVTAPSKAAARAIARYLAEDRELLERQFYATDDDIIVRSVTLIDDREVVS